MKKILAAASAILMLAASEAQASGYYIEGQFGAASANQVENTDEIETESESHFFGGIAVGRKFESPLGIDGLEAYLEGNLAIRSFELHGLNSKNSNSAATGDITSIGLYSNIWLGYEITPAFEIYAGGGPGVTLIGADNITSAGMGLNDASDSEIAFSYNLGAGAMYDLGEDWTIGLGYRYAAVPRYSLKSSQGELTSHAVMLGLRYNF